jgi:hypothetical protein
VDIDTELRNLLDLQDSVTHENEKGVPYIMETQRLISKRDWLRRDIVEYVRGLEQRVAELEATDGTEAE